MNVINVYIYIYIHTYISGFPTGVEDMGCKFTKNECLHTYCAFSRNHVMEGCYTFQWGSLFFRWWGFIFNWGGGGPPWRASFLMWGVWKKYHGMGGDAPPSTGKPVFENIKWMYKEY